MSTSSRNWWQTSGHFYNASPNTSSNTTNPHVWVDVGGQVVSELLHGPTVVLPAKLASLEVLEGFSHVGLAEALADQDADSAPQRDGHDHV